MLQRKISVAAVSKAASTVGACLLGIATLAAISACGQKGPLILPKTSTAAASAAAAPASSPASTP